MVLVGYIRVPKSAGSQTLTPQRDAIDELRRRGVGLKVIAGAGAQIDTKARK